MKLNKYLAAAVLLACASATGAGEVPGQWNLHAASAGQGYSYGNDRYFLSAFSLNDTERALEQGITYKSFKEDGPAFKVALSRFSRISLSDPSWLAKIDHTVVYRTGQNTVLTATNGLGYFMLPSELTFTPRYVNDPYTLHYICFRTDHRLSNEETVPLSENGKYFMNWKAGFKGILSVDEKSVKRFEEIDGSFTYGRLYADTSLHRAAGESGDVYLGYYGAVQNSFSLLIMPLQNHELYIGFSAPLAERLKAGLCAFEPLKYQIYRENYLFQDRRVSAGLDYSLSRRAGIGASALADKGGRVYGSAKLAIDLGAARATALFAQNTLDTVYSIGIELGFGKTGLKLSEYNYRKIIRPTYVYYKPAAAGLPPATASFEDAVAMLDTPEKIASYDGERLSYLSDNNGSGFLSGWYSPEEVYRRQGGNCAEQMSFESYVLRRHGYESYLLGFTAPGVNHDMCVYRDKTTGLWDVMDYDRVLPVNASTPEGAIEKIYPNWFFAELLDPVSFAPVKHVDSMTRWMITDWFEGND